MTTAPTCTSISRVALARAAGRRGRRRARTPCTRSRRRSCRQRSASAIGLLLGVALADLVPAASRARSPAIAGISTRGRRAVAASTSSSGLGLGERVWQPVGRGVRRAGSCGCCGRLAAGGDGLDRREGTERRGVAAGEHAGLAGGQRVALGLTAGSTRPRRRRRPCLKSSTMALADGEDDGVAGDSTNEPSIGSGRRRPFSSGSPSRQYCSLMPATLPSLPLISTGATR